MEEVISEETIEEEAGEGIATRDGEMEEGTAQETRAEESGAGEETRENGTPRKEKPEAVIRGGASRAANNVSGKTNKQLIQTAAAGVIVAMIVVSVFSQAFKSESKKEKTPVKTVSAADPRATDYRRLVPAKERPIESGRDDEEIALPALPPLDDAVQTEASPLEEPAPPAPARSGATYSGSYAPERPVTRDDRLQAKSISGIKGITSTQKYYLDGSTGMPAQQRQPASANPYAQYGLPPKEQYAQQALGAYDGLTAAQPQAAGGYAAQTAPTDYAGSYTAQNDQSGKMSFYQNGREGAGMGQYLPLASIWQGTIFEATLTAAINTDLPGEVTAMITKNVYSSLDGKYLLIPQNSRLFGTYNSSISYSQSRVQVGWHTLIRPDGYAVRLGNMQATDAQGAAGLPGIINDHPFQYLKAIGLISAFRILGGELGTTAAQLNNNNAYVQNLIADTQNMINQFGAKIIDRALDVQPTIVITAGTPINIVANQTLLLPPLDPYPVTQSYRR
jgi:type IV secretion system protein VirB10